MNLRIQRVMRILKKRVSQNLVKDSKRLKSQGSRISVGRKTMLEDSLKTKQTSMMTKILMKMLVRSMKKRGRKYGNAMIRIDKPTKDLTFTI